VLRVACCVLLCCGSATGGHFSKALAGYSIVHVQQFLKKYLQCVLAAKILTVDFFVCTLAAKKKSGQISTCRIGPFFFFFFLVAPTLGSLLQL
jgi:hypothetical protein